jgi:predicted secreted Zn-dependent protease
MPACALLLALTSACARRDTRTVEERALHVAAPAGVDLRTRLVPYALHAATHDGRAKEMLRSGPVVDGQRFAAATTWYLRWHYALDARGAQCRLRDVRAQLEARFDYPTWAPADGRDSASAREWEAFSRRVLAHERGHLELAVGTARTVVETLRPISAGSCDAVRAGAERSAQQLLEVGREREREYDRVTQHGTLVPTPSRLLVPTADRPLPSRAREMRAR